MGPMGVMRAMGQGTLNGTIILANGVHDCCTFQVVALILSSFVNTKCARLNFASTKYISSTALCGKFGGHVRQSKIVSRLIHVLMTKSWPEFANIGSNTNTNTPTKSHINC